MTHSSQSRRFTAVDECPRCKLVAVHRIRKPNPEPPKVVIPASEQGREVLTVWGGQAVQVIEAADVYDRPDERGYEVMRVCECGREWGCT